jgi:hypothetical protein
MHRLAQAETPVLLRYIWDTNDTLKFNELQAGFFLDNSYVTI